MNVPEFVRVELKDAGTPICNGFGAEFKGKAWLGHGGPLADNIVWDDTSIRYITDQQIKDHFIVSNSEFMAQDLARRQIAELKQKLLNSYNGMLVKPYDVEPKPYPANIQSQWGSVRVIVADNSPMVEPTKHDQWWWAHWWYTDMGQRLFYLQTAIAQAISKLSPDERAKWLLDTFQHEMVESDDALRRAKQMYPAATIAQMQGLTQQFGGVSHLKAITEVEHQPNEAKYNRSYYNDLRAIGIKTKEKS